MATLTASRSARHRAPRRPVHERLADWLDAPHPHLAEFGEAVLMRAMVWALPGAIVVVAITTRGAA